MAMARPGFGPKRARTCRVGARICETRSQLGVHFGGVNVNDEV